MKTAQIRMSALLPVAVAAALAGAASGDADGSGYRSQIESWVEGRVERLVAPDGYLSIVGLFPLVEGRNTFGSDPSSDIVFPDKAPRHMGHFEVGDGVVWVSIDAGVEVLHDGKPVETLALADDTAGDGPTVLERGTLSWYVIDRSGKKFVRLKDSESELRMSFGEIDRFPIDEKWCIEASLETYRPDKYVTFTNSIDLKSRERVYGTIIFEIDGETHRLDALGEPEAKSLFVIFADATSGLETYGAGRYLYVEAPDVDGKVIIDFNKAYNPPCAFNQYTTCLLPPYQNFLPIRVTAGELVYQKSSR